MTNGSTLSAIYLFELLLALTNQDNLNILSPSRIKYRHRETRLSEEHAWRGLLLVA